MPDTPITGTVKPWYQSTTLYALLVAIAAKLIVLAGLMGEDEASAVATELVTQLLMLVALGADLYGMYGRSRAKGPLALTAEKAEVRNIEAAVVAEEKQNA